MTVELACLLDFSLVLVTLEIFAKVCDMIG